MKKSLLYTTLAAMLAIAVVLYVNEPYKSRVAFIASQTRYTLNQSELAILGIILRDDIANIDLDYKTLLTNDLPSASIDQIEEAYNENQVAADEQYYNKLIYITGYVTSINSGLGNKPYILLHGLNPLLSPQAHFEEGNIKRIASIRKGQKIFLVCKGGGILLGTPILNNCQFASDYMWKKLPEIKLENDNFLSGKEIQSERIKFTILAVITAARLLPKSSACFNKIDDKRCLVEIKSVFKKISGRDKITDQKINGIAKELISLGIHIRKSDKTTSKKQAPICPYFHALIAVKPIRPHNSRTYSASDMLCIRYDLHLNMTIAIWICRIKSQQSYYEGTP